MSLNARFYIALDSIGNDSISLERITDQVNEDY